MPKILISNPPKSRKRRRKKKAAAVKVRRRRRSRPSTRTTTRTVTVARKSTRRRGRSRSRSGGSARGFITKDLLMTVVGTTAGAALPPIVAGRLAPKLMATPQQAALTTAAVGVGLAFAAYKAGQRPLARAMLVGAGASALSQAVAKFTAKPASGTVKGLGTLMEDGGMSGLYELPQANGLRYTA